ncbi:MAG: hypothetical protein GXY98_04620 [Erysipelothrix sp.]|nr:hypothetical protein [Erysipelothrix sp.]
MKRKIRKIILVLTCLIPLFTGLSDRALAYGTINVVASKVNPKVGETITITATYTYPVDDSAGGEVTVSSSNTEVLSVEGSSRKADFGKSKSLSFQFKAKAAGTAVITAKLIGGDAQGSGEAQGTISITVYTAPVVTTKTETKTDVVVPFKTVEQKDSTLEKGKTVVKQEGKNGIATVTYTVTYTDGKETSSKEVSRTVTTDPINKIVLVGTKVTNAPVVEKSNDATLKGLTISEGVLSPTFNKETKSYSVDLKGDVTSVTITGTVNDTKASISGNGTVSLPEFGSKSHSLVVTAEDGTKNTITISFKKPEKVIEKISLGTGYTWQAYTGDRVLKGYTVEPLEIDGKEITTYVSSSGDVVVYALNEAGNGNFYHYDKETKTIGEKFETVAINETEYVIVKIPTDMVKQGMKQESFTLSGVNLNAFSFKDESLKDYRVLYLSKQGEKPSNYLFDTKSNTLLDIGDAQLLSKDEMNQLGLDKPGEHVDQTPGQPIVIEDTSLVSVLFLVIGMISLLCLILSVVLLNKSKASR